MSSDVSAVPPQRTRLLPDHAQRPADTHRTFGGWRAGGIATLVLLAVTALIVTLHPQFRSWTSSASAPSASSTPVATPSSGPPSSSVQTTTRLLTIPAGGPLFSNDEAQAKGPAICEQVGGRFNVAWFTPGQTAGEYSMVTCAFVFEPTTRRVLDIDAGGAISDEEDARKKAPQICAKAGGTWNREWRDVVSGKYSVVNCTIAF